MDVATIVDRVIEYSLDEDEGDNVLKNKALADVQEIYEEVLAELAAIEDQFNLSSVSTTLSSGSYSIGDHIDIIQVLDVTNDRVLQESDEVYIRSQDPDLSETGTPRYWYLQDNVLKVYPSEDINVYIQYYPAANDLALDTANHLEADIRIPPLFHEVLVLGGIYKMSVREQGFHDARDRGEKLREYREKKQELLTYSYNKNRSIQRRRSVYSDY